MDLEKSQQVPGGRVERNVRLLLSGDSARLCKAPGVLISVGASADICLHQVVKRTLSTYTDVRCLFIYSTNTLQFLHISGTAQESAPAYFLMPVGRTDDKQIAPSRHNVREDIPVPSRAQTKEQWRLPLTAELRVGLQKRGASREFQTRPESKKKGKQ